MIVKAFEFYTYFPILHLGSIILRKGLAVFAVVFKDSLSG